jgi:hypothetical protein
MDDFCFGFCDCFINTWQSDFQNGYMEFPVATRNIGGPAPEAWNPAVLIVSAGQAYSDLSVGHGTNREYWTVRSDQFKRFCGWECPSVYRLSDGSCALTVHDETSCPDPLSSKVDTASFNVGVVTSAAAAGEAAGEEREGGPDPGEAMLEQSLDIAERLERARSLLATSTSAVWDELARRTRANDLDDEGFRLLALTADPMAAAVPHLEGASQEERLRTLRWMLTVPDPLRLAGLFGDLREDWELGRTAREELAVARVGDLIALLEDQGVRASWPPSDPLATLVEDAPAPNHFPPEMVREVERLHLLDPDAFEFLSAARRATLFQQP